MDSDSNIEFGATVRAFVPGMRVFNRFELIRMLGRGGMGVVWLSRDEHLQLDIALKFLPEAVGVDESAVADMARETRQARGLAHPHIVRVFDFHQDATLAGISMEFVDGSTLASLRHKREPAIFEPAELVPWVEQLSEALDYAHRRARIVHRDLKPANLMVDAHGEIKVADFGISASVSESVTRVSRVASSSGSPPYMSPQQIMGERPVPTDDIYALGATLYELVTGKPPFYAGNIVVQAQTKVPPPLTERRAEFGIGGQPIPPAWESTIAASLAKNPADRPQTIREFVSRLNLRPTVTLSDSLGDGVTMLAPGASAPATLQPPVPADAPKSRPGRKSRWMLGGIAAALVATAGVISWTMIGPRSGAPGSEAPGDVSPDTGETRPDDPARPVVENVPETVGPVVSPGEMQPDAAVSSPESNAPVAPVLSQAILALSVGGAVDYELFVDGRVVPVDAGEASIPAGRPVQLSVRARGFRTETRVVSPAPGSRESWEVMLREQELPREGRPWTVPELDLAMIWITPGEFSMGSPESEAGRSNDEGPQTRVRVTRGFWLGKHEVTQGEWRAVMGNAPARFRAVGERAPVEQVSWNDAMEFCQKLTDREREAGRLPDELVYDLPTEAQWEYACRAGTTGAFSFGASSGPLHQFGNFADVNVSFGWRDGKQDDGVGETTAAVGRYRPNGFGLHDMHGNVWEWCTDRYAGALPGGAVEDPTGPNAGGTRVARGGSWNFAASFCRSASRLSKSPAARSADIGFRVALVPVQ